MDASNVPLARTDVCPNGTPGPGPADGDLAGISRRGSGDFGAASDLGRDEHPGLKRGTTRVLTPAGVALRTGSAALGHQGVPDDEHDAPHAIVTDVDRQQIRRDPPWAA